MSADFAALRHEVYRTNVELPEAGLVTMPAAT
jgi:hypothetical protein